MSEPFSLVVACQITPEDLRTWLGGMIPPPEHYADWNELEFQLYPGDYEAAQSDATRKPQSVLRSMREFALQDYGWRFRHDAPSGQLNIVNLTWTENWTEIIAGLTVFRSLAPRCPQGGYILVHGFAFRQGTTACALNFTGGRSMFVRSPASDSLVQHAAPLASHVLQKAQAAFESDPRPSPDQVCTDQLDEFAPT